MKRHKMNALFLGRATLDISYVVESFPIENTKIFSNQFILQPGGPALNAAITYSLLGGSGTIISHFGTTTMASMVIAQAIDKFKLSVVDLVDNIDYEFPVSSIIIHPSCGTRTIINSPKTKRIYKVKKIIYDAALDMILLDGYNLEGNIEFIKEKKQQGAIIVLDGGSWKDTLIGVLPYIDIAICSDRFLFPETNKEETIRSLHKLGVDLVAFTQEANPIQISTNGQLKSIPVPTINAVDTLGAGDVLHGAFCYYYSKYKDFEESIKRAAIIASKSCKYYGTQTWIEHE